MDSAIDLIYLLDWHFSPKSGVGKKVIEQIQAWNQNGLRTVLIVATHKEYSKDWMSLSIPIKVFDYEPKNLFTRSRARNLALKCAKNLCPKGIYVRFGVLSPKLVLELSKTPTILELNFKGFDEYKRRSNLLCIYIILLQKFVFPRCAGACSVTNEIKDEFDRLVIHKVPSSTFPNSIDLASNPVTKYRQHVGIHLIFVGTPGNVWHGVDRIVTLAEALPEYDFHCVGPSRPAGELMPKNIHFPGEIFGDALRTYMESMDVAISSMALDRNTLGEASPLKTRLYLACGLPVIGRYNDTAITPGAKYFLNLSEESWPPSEEVLEKVRSFVSAWLGQRVDHKNLSNIDSRNIELRRVQFIREILGLNK